MPVERGLPLAGPTVPVPIQLRSVRAVATRNPAGVNAVEFGAVREGSASRARAGGGRASDRSQCQDGQLDHTLGRRLHRAPFMVVGGEAEETVTPRAGVTPPMAEAEPIGIHRGAVSSETRYYLVPTPAYAFVGGGGVRARPAEPHRAAFRMYLASVAIEAGHGDQRPLNDTGLAITGGGPRSPGVCTFVQDLGWRESPQESRKSTGTVRSAFLASHGNRVPSSQDSGESRSNGESQNRLNGRPRRPFLDPRRSRHRGRTEPARRATFEA